MSMELGAQWLSGRVLDSRPKGRGFEPHRRHCVVVLEHIHPSIVLVQPRKTRPYITERLLMGHKESNKQNKCQWSCSATETSLSIEHFDVARNAIHSYMGSEYQWSM